MALKFPKGNTGIRTIKEKLFKFFSRKKYDQDFIALREINFEVLEGEVIGIIGRNGAGKSTLLRVIAGIYQPDEGMVKVRGKVSLLASVGERFNELIREECTPLWVNFGVAEKRNRGKNARNNCLFTTREFYGFSN